MSVSDSDEISVDDAITLAEYGVLQCAALVSIVPEVLRHVFEPYMRLGDDEAAHQDDLLLRCQDSAARLFCDLAKVHHDVLTTKIKPGILDLIFEANTAEGNLPLIHRGFRTDRVVGLSPATTYHAAVLAAIGDLQRLPWARLDEWKHPRIVELFEPGNAGSEIALDIQLRSLRGSGPFWRAVLEDVKALSGFRHMGDLTTAIQFEKSSALDWWRKQQANDADRYSKPDTPKRWAKQFGISVDTFKRRVAGGQIKAKRLSDRSYRIHLDDLPPESGPVKRPPTQRK